MAGYQSVAQRNLTCAIRIRERRRQLGLTQAEVTGRIELHGSRLSNQALSAIENGRRLAVGRLPDLAAALDCTVTYLLGLTVDPRRWEPDNPPAPTGPPSPVAPPRRNWILGPDVPDLPPARLHGSRLDGSRLHETGAAIPSPTPRRPR